MNWQRDNILRLWRLGQDALAIKLITGISEPDVLEIITEERSARLELASPYDRPVRRAA